MTRSLLVAVVTALALPAAAQQTTDLPDRVVVAESDAEGVDFILSQSQIAELAASVLKEPDDARFVGSRIERAPAYRLIVDVELAEFPGGTDPQLVMPLEVLDYKGKQLLVVVRPRA